MIPFYFSPFTFEEILLQQKYSMIIPGFTDISILKDRGYKASLKAKKQGSDAILFLKVYDKSERPLINDEMQVYSAINQPHLHGFPQLKQTFEHGTKVYMVFEELGQNIESLRVRCGGRLSLKTVLMAGLQMVERLEHVHLKGYLHGDIKPSNFLVGKGKLKHKIYLTDFELSTPFLKDGKPRNEEQTDHFSGSLRFISQRVNSRKSACPKDELESLLYSLIFLLKGELPWMKLNAKSIPQAYEQVAQIKSGSRGALLEGLPSMFGRLLERLDGMKYNTAPNYEEFRKSLGGLMAKNGYEMDYKYDWEFH